MRNTTSKSHRKHGGWNKGMTKFTHPEETTYGMPGDKHWNWKGGVSSLHNRLRQSSQYRWWRKSVFERDHYTCQICGKQGGYLQADHIKSYARYPELRFDLSNGRTLCLKCHRQVTNEQRDNDYYDGEIGNDSKVS